MQVIQQGNQGALTSLLQLGLTRAGYPVEQDGVFGAQTARALTRFQTAYGLTADAIAGARTWGALEPYLTGVMSYRVRAGDTFYRLARRYGVTVEAIQTANPGVRPERLAIGQRINLPLAFTSVPVGIPWSYSLLTYALQGLKGKYPFLSLYSMGRSVMGKSLPVVTIGTGERQVLYNAAHHANEWLTTPVLLKFLEDYAKAVATGGMIYGQSARNLFQTTTLYLVPMVNPDGVDLVTGAMDADNLYYQNALALAENYPAIPFPNGWKANIQGVDLNLNYPARWHTAKTIKYALGFTTPGPRDFVGDAPLSQPESKALHRLTLEQDFRLTLSYHSQGEIIYWKYLDYEPENSLEIAHRMREVSGYAVEETPQSSGYAGYKDWFIQQYNRPGYTIEVGKGVSPLPLSQFEKIYRDNLGILVLGLELS